MSETTILPGGPSVPVSIGGDGSTIIDLNNFGGPLSTDYDTTKNLGLDGFVAAAALPVGTPVYVQTAAGINTVPPKLAAAFADDDLKSVVFGLLTEAATLLGPCKTKDRGLLTLTVAEWNAVVQGATTGLVPGIYYYLNFNEAQKPIIPGAPVSESDAVVILGSAVTPTTLKVSIVPITPLVS